jgi:anti-anti-sigma regulatory factor
MLGISTAALSDYLIVRLTGVLDIRTYRQVRDAVTKAALDHHGALIVDVDGLEVCGDYAWAVFTSARWQVNQWPDFPIVLVSSDAVRRRRLAGLSIARYVPVFESAAAAAAAIAEGTCRYRHRARARFARHDGGLRAAQMFVRNHLIAWSMFDKIPLTTMLATVFIENASSYAGDGCDLRLEGSDEELVVAVSDSCLAEAIRRDRVPACIPAGLDIVAALCRRWGSTQTSDGKVVWAHIDSGSKPLQRSGGVVEDQAQRVALAGAYHG